MSRSRASFGEQPAHRLREVGSPAVAGGTRPAVRADGRQGQPFEAGVEVLYALQGAALLLGDAAEPGPHLVQGAFALGGLQPAGEDVHGAVEPFGEPGVGDHDGRGAGGLRDPVAHRPGDVSVGDHQDLALAAGERPVRGTGDPADPLDVVRLQHGRGR
jgi:hypothetical protein